MTDECSNTRTETIRQLNDAFRSTFQGGRILTTRGISALPLDFQATIFHLVRTFDAFTTDNDPYGERDFGAIECAGEKVFFKIDYYAPDMEHGSEDPSDPKQTTRVLTIMLAEEY